MIPKFLHEQTTNPTMADQPLYEIKKLYLVVFLL